MIKILGKGRKLIRKFFLFLGVAAISLVFQACYGMPIDECTGGEDCDCYNGCDCYNCRHDRNRPDDTGTIPTE